MVDSARSNPPLSCRFYSRGSGVTCKLRASGRSVLRSEAMGGSRRDKWFLGSTAAAAAALVLLLFGLIPPLVALRPLRERDSAAGGGPWGDERLFLRSYESDLSPYSAWNITGTYKGRWNFVETTNGSSRLFDFGNSNGESVLELVSTSTKISGVHYVQGAVTFHDVFDSMHDHGFSKLRLEGVYIWPFRQLRMVASSLVCFLLKYFKNLTKIKSGGENILPEKYCYYRKPEKDNNQIADCVICMTGIDLTQQRSNDYMVTPCDHFFHTGCLQRWMDIKMECPTCRRSLPPA
ncbi:zinc finger protein [Musa troglodytarum]|uniref:RING-type E3 ubiquitin transferase n=1 Tax=Musa troglodytarum TaxID=320322 RepID=A0A9E7GTS3_9LILI|nr:zinc finger protein [Musa troglodytarum]